MDFPVKMPRLGEEMTKGKVIEWLKKEGEPINEKEVLFVVDTEKAALEVESLATGVLKKIIVSDPDQEIKVGEVIGIIETK